VVAARSSGSARQRSIDRGAITAGHLAGLHSDSAREGARAAVKLGTLKLQTNTYM
jgi:hypothetical protein